MTFAAYLLQSDKGLDQVKVLGGWSRTTTLERYTKLAPAYIGEELLEYSWDFREQKLSNYPKMSHSKGA